MIKTIMHHGGVMTCLLIELIVNNIAFKWKHLNLVMIPYIIYLLSNLLISVIHKPVYSVMNWKSLLSYAFLVGGIGLTILTFLMGKMFYDKIKVKRIGLMNN